MRWARSADKMRMVVVAVASLALPSLALGQAAVQDKAKPSSSNVTGSAKADVEVQAIDDDYFRQLLQLDQRRLEQLRPSGLSTDASRGRGHLRAALPPGDRR